MGGGGGGRPSWRIHRSAAHNGHGFNGEREREAAKRFSRNAGGAIPFDFVEKKKKKGKPVTIHHRESPFFPNDDDSLVRFLISVAVIRFVIFPFRPNRFESSSSLSFFSFLSSFSIHLYSIS